MEQSSNGSVARLKAFFFASPKRSFLLGTLLVLAGLALDHFFAVGDLAPP